MKKLVLGAIAAIACSAAVVGCKSIPTDSQMYTTSYAVGASTGLIADMTKIDDKTRNKVIEIVNIVDTHIPQTNETFTEAWTPIANRYIAKWVEDGDINAAQGVLISKTFDIACNGIDYLFNIRYPQARQYQDLTAAATHGFCDGFLVTFKPANTLTATGTNVQIDKAAYEYLSAKYIRPKMVTK